MRVRQGRVDAGLREGKVWRLGIRVMHPRVSVLWSVGSRGGNGWRGLRIELNVRFEFEVWFELYAAAQRGRGRLWVYGWGACRRGCGWVR
jgi:hypothetical protein